MKLKMSVKELARLVAAADAVERLTRGGQKGLSRKLSAVLAAKGRGVFDLWAHLYSLAQFARELESLSVELEIDPERKEE